MQCIITVSSKKTQTVIHFTSLPFNPPYTEYMLNEATQTSTKQLHYSHDNVLNK